METAPAIFRTWTEDDVRFFIALFPTLAADDGSGDVESFLFPSAFGQGGFGAADFDEWMGVGRLTTADEQDALTATLAELGWACRPVSDRTPEMLAAFQAELARWRTGG